MAWVLAARSTLARISCADSKGLGRLVARFQVVVEFGNTAEHAAADALQLAERSTRLSQEEDVGMK